MVSKFAYGQQYVSNICKYFWKAVLYIYSLSTIGCEQHFKLFWKAVSSHLFLWPTGSEWHCTFCERQYTHFLMTNRKWVIFCGMQFNQIISYDQQRVSDIAQFVKGSFITYQQPVSVIAHSVEGSHTTSFPMTSGNYLSVILHILWKAVSWHLFLWQTASEWHCAFCEKAVSWHLFLWPTASWVMLHILWKAVSWHLFLNRLWMTFHILWKAVSWHLFLWPTDCEWHSTFCEDSLMTSFPITNRLWVTLHILWKELSWHLFLWPTDCEGYCTFSERQSLHIFPYNQQGVSDISHVVQGSLITSFAMTNSLWVTLQMVKGSLLSFFLWPTARSEWYCTFCETVSSHHFLWPIESEWYSTFCEMQSLHIFPYDQQGVSGITHFVKGSLSLWPAASEWHCTFLKCSLIASFLMTNRLWVTLHIIVKGSHIISFPMTNSKLSAVAHFVKGSLIT